MDKEVYGSDDDLFSDYEMQQKPITKNNHPGPFVPSIEQIHKTFANYQQSLYGGEIEHITPVRKYQSAMWLNKNKTL